jgi:hypothetical protein
LTAEAKLLSHTKGERMSRWRRILRPIGEKDLPVADLMQFEALARPRLSQMAYDYVRSGGADEITMRENRLGFERLRLAPNVLMDVSQLDTRVTLFGSGADCLSSALLRGRRAGHSARSERSGSSDGDQLIHYDCHP